ncbi:hypothetical protein TNCV_218161 [Trichonephila clavipes]|nr:hypothetical protein TNCV_218161 [Trichonephila clavipes]
MVSNFIQLSSRTVFLRLDSKMQISVVLTKVLAEQIEERKTGSHRDLKINKVDVRHHAQFSCYSLLRLRVGHPDISYQANQSASSINQRSDAITVTQTIGTQRPLKVYLRAFEHMDSVSSECLEND